jgi:potassium-transporting ATPase KdpC subunit
MDLAQVLGLINAHTTDRALGFLGEKAVNVLKLNLGLDQQPRVDNSAAGSLSTCA